jgi:hypothetical protein
MLGVGHITKDYFGKLVRRGAVANAKATMEEAGLGAGSQRERQLAYVKKQIAQCKATPGQVGALPANLHFHWPAKQWVLLHKKLEVIHGVVGIVALRGLPCITSAGCQVLFTNLYPDIQHF